MLYRSFRNSDPPELMKVWNESLVGRGAFILHNASSLEKWITSKTYFEPDDFLIAIDDETKSIAGFTLSGFGPTEDRQAQEPSGVICAVLVRPAFRRRGIGRTLLQMTRERLIQRGAQIVVVGSQRPYNPYLFGLYGGANSPGVLESDTLADPFLQACGYQKYESHRVYQRKLEQPLAFADGRFVGLRRRFEIEEHFPTTSQSWWEECIWGTLEPTEYRIIDKMTRNPVGRLVNWDLDGFSERWAKPATGIFDVEIRAHVRRQGLAKFLLANVLKLLQDKFYTVAELQVWGDDPAGIGICESLGFDLVDTGYRYREATSLPGAANTTTQEYQHSRATR
jgi:ribosomal protein S18 acetylase RimI-like enzyme